MAAQLPRWSNVKGEGGGTGGTGRSETEASLRMPRTMKPALKSEKGMPRPVTAAILPRSAPLSVSTANGSTTSAGT